MGAVRPRRYNSGAARRTSAGIVLAAIAAALFWGACGSDDPNTSSDPSKTAATATREPTRTPTPTPIPPTATARPTHGLPACYVAGQDRCNCSDFTTQAFAQWFHDNFDPVDVNGLDGTPKNGIACDSLP